LTPPKGGGFRPERIFDCDIDNFAVAAVPSQGRLPILFDGIEKECIIREIFLDGKVADLV